MGQLRCHRTSLASNLRHGRLRRQLADFLKPTYMFQLDFDHVKKEDMVIEKEPIELNSDAAVDPTDTFEDKVSYFRPVSMLLSTRKYNT